MGTRYGRNVFQDLADLSNQEVAPLRVGRLAAKYADAVKERHARDEAAAREFRLNVPHLTQVKNRIAEQLEKNASQINGKLPVAAIFDAYRRVKAHKDVDRDPGLRALLGHLEEMWKRDRTGSLTASTYLKLHDHYKKRYPKSAAASVIEEIGQHGYATLPVSDLTHIASQIQTQKDFEYLMVKHGIDGQQPHQVKARRYIIALLNNEENPRPFDREGERREAQMTMQDLDDFTRGYVIAALWSSTNDEGFQLGDRYDIEDIDNITLAKMIMDCKSFQDANAADLEEYYDQRIPTTSEPVEAYAGHDFWLTRNGHGAGFWDRSELDEDLAGRLTDAASAYGNFDLYVGDDEKVYGN